MALILFSIFFQVNFGSIILPSGDIPKEKSLGPLPTLAHGVKSDDVIIVDSKTLLIKNLYYDGAGPGTLNNAFHKISCDFFYK